MEPTISFTIPYYRGLDYLREAIDSVRAQSIDSWELVVVDDRGPEPADGVVDEYEDERIRYIRNDRNLGLAGNWNACLRAARAPMVTILHADDRLMPSYAASVLAAAARQPEAAVFFTDSFNIGPDGERMKTFVDVVKNRLPRPDGDHLVAGDDGLAGLLFGNYIICPSMCLRVGAVGLDPFVPHLKFVPDWEFTTRVLLEGGQLYGLRDRLIEYRRHPETATSALTADSSRFVEELELMRLRAKESRELGLHRSARTARRRLTVRVHLAVRAVLDLTAGRWSAARDKLRILFSDLAGRPVGVHDANPQQ